MKKSIKSGLLLMFGGLLLIVSCTSETKKTEVNTSGFVEVADSSELFIMDEEIYSILNELLNELPGGSDSNIIVNLALNTELKETAFYFTEPTDLEKRISAASQEGIGSFLGTKVDSVFIRKQLNAHKGKFWIPGRFRGISENDELLSHYESNGDFDWEAFKKDGFGCIESYGIPTFNVDSSRCTLKISGVCHGSIGFGSTLLFERKEGKWTYVGQMKGWMS